MSDVIETAVADILRAIGEDGSREGLARTPARVAKALSFWTQGYQQDPAALLTTFQDNVGDCNEMITVVDIPVYSLCEHHLAPFFGHAHVAYIPEKSVIGLSKIPRLVQIYMRRLQVQERLTNQIADALHKYLKPKGVAVTIQCRHMCMESRGIQVVGASTVTSALRGVFHEPAARSEFFNFVSRKVTL